MAAAAYTPHAAAPRPGAGYVDADGTIEVVVAHGMKGLIDALNAQFVQTHPGVRFHVREGDNYSGMATLTFDVTAFAPLTSEYTRIGIGDNLKIVPEPTGFRIAHGSLKPGAVLSPLAVIVNRNNPLDHLTLDQMTRVFAVGGPVGDLTRWSQLGVEGALSAREIAPYGPPAGDYSAFEDAQVGEFLSLRKLNGLNFSHAYEPQASYDDVVKRVAEDQAGIGIVALNHLSPEGAAGGASGVKVLGLSAVRAGTPYRGSAEDIRAGRYALDRFLYIYLRANPGMAFDPFAKEYMRFVLSAQGQEIIAAGAEGYIPLNPRELADELGRLEP